MAADLSSPRSGETQSAIIGEISWTRLEGAAAPVQDVEFALDGVFYGSLTQYDPTISTSWWTSTDAIHWDEFVDIPDESSGVHLASRGETMWAETYQRRPAAGADSSLYRWDGTAFAPFVLPAPEPAPGEGLVIREMTSSVVAAFDGKWIILRKQWFGIPWADLLDVEPPLEVSPNGQPWAETFNVGEEQRCYDFDASSGCGNAHQGEHWRIRPEVINADPVRIDLFDDATGELITSIVPPDDQLATLGVDQLLEDLGRYNVLGDRTETFVASSDGTVVRSVAWPFPVGGTYPTWAYAQFAELDGRLFALSDGGDTEAALWRSSDLESWEPLPLPDDISPWASLVIDGSQLALDTGSALFSTSDGRSWTRVINSPSDEWPIPESDRQPAAFGWMEAGDLGRADVEYRSVSPVIAVSPDGTNWQLIPVPLPSPIEERGLTWSDTNEPLTDGGTALWDWHASAHDNTIFIVLRGLEGQGQEIWVGQVDPP